MAFCCWSMVLKVIPSILGIWLSASWNLLENKVLISSFTLLGSTIHIPSMSSHLMQFLFVFAFILIWKYLVLQSPSFSHLDLDFCLSNDSWAWAATHKSSCNCFLLQISKSVICLCNVSSSSLFSSSSRFWTFLKLSPYSSLFHIFSLHFSLLISIFFNTLNNC